MDTRSLKSEKTDFDDNQEEGFLYKLKFCYLVVAMKIIKPFKFLLVKYLK